jgi:hypothetical protein
MSREDAKQIALKYLGTLEARSGVELALQDEETIERSFGWVFFYQSKRYLENLQIRDAVAGNAPIVVTKSDGRLHPTGTAFPIELYLKQFENYMPQP